MDDLDSEKHFQADEETSRGLLRPLVVGLDCRSSDDFFVTNNSERFPDAHDVLADVDYISLGCANDAMNSFLCESFYDFGVDVLFSSRIVPLVSVLRSGLCKVLMIHPHKNDACVLQSIFQGLPVIPSLMYLYSSFPKYLEPVCVNLFEGIEGVYELADGSVMCLKTNFHGLKEYILHSTQYGSDEIK